MKTFKPFIFIVIIFFIIALSAIQTSAAPGPAGYAEIEKEAGYFFKAKEYVFKSEWKEASERLEFYLQRFPGGQYRDEALYWLAKSLDRTSRSIRDVDQMILEKEKALRYLERLINRFPQSLWRDDALAFRVELAGELVLAGKKEYRKYIEEAIKKENKDEADIKLIALNSLFKLDPGPALQIVSRILSTEKDPRIRKRAVWLIGRYPTPKIIPILEKVAQQDADEAVKKEAHFWLKRSKLFNIPVQLNYYILSGNLTGTSQDIRFKENQITPFSLPEGIPGDDEDLRKRITRNLNFKISHLRFQALTKGASSMYGGNVAHNVNNNHFMLLQDTVLKNTREISGKFRIVNKDTRKEEHVSFSVTLRENRVFAIRKGKTLTLLVMQFQERKKEDMSAPVESSPDDLTINAEAGGNKLLQWLGLEEKPIYNIEFSDILGCRVLSTQRSLNLATLKGGIMDFAQAKATIPTKEGDWTLMGHLLLSKKERRFIGRKAVLLNPNGKMAASGLEIAVPVDHPEKFKIIK